MADAIGEAPLDLSGLRHRRQITAIQVVRIETEPRRQLGRTSPTASFRDLENQPAHDLGERARRLADRAELRGLAPLGPVLHGDPERTIVHTVNLSFPGLDGEAVIVAVKDLVAISNSSACTSQSYTPSHVLKAMGLPREQIQGALRISWSHLTEGVDWAALTTKIGALT